MDNWQSMDVLTVLDVLIEPNAAALVDGNSLVAALENIELVPSEFFVLPQGTLVGTMFLIKG